MATAVTTTTTRGHGRTPGVCSDVRMEENQDGYRTGFYRSCTSCRFLSRGWGSEGLPAEKGGGLWPPAAGPYRQLTEAGALFTAPVVGRGRGEQDAGRSRARGEHGAKGKAPPKPDGGRRGFQTHPATRNASAPHKQKRDAGRQLSPAGRGRGRGGGQGWMRRSRCEQWGPGREPRPWAQKPDSPCWSAGPSPTPTPLCTSGVPTLPTSWDGWEGR